MPRDERPYRHIRQVCHHCRRLHTAESNQGIYFRCQWCEKLNVGPQLLAEYGIAPPAPRRPARRAAPAPAPARAPRRSFLDVLRGGPSR